MSTCARTLALAVLSLSVAMSTASPARADLLDDIIAVATSARDRAKEARDRAKEARDKAEEIRLAVQAGVQTLTGNLRDVIADAIEEGKETLDEELDGRDAFVNGGKGETFRSNLITLLSEFEGIFNQLATIDPDASLDVSFDREIDLIEKVPLAALWPLYRAASTVDFLNSGLINRLKETNSALEVAIPVFLGDDGGAGSRAARSGGADKASKEGAAKTLRVGSVVLLVAGKGIQAASKFYPDLKDKTIGIHGYALITIKSASHLEGVGVVIEILSSVMAFIGDAVQARVDAEDSEANQNAILDNQQTILANQAMILQRLGVPEHKNKKERNAK